MIRLLASVARVKGPVSPVNLCPHFEHSHMPATVLETFWYWQLGHVNFCSSS